MFVYGGCNKVAKVYLDENGNPCKRWQTPEEKAKRREYMKKYYEVNEEKLKERSKKWREANKEKYREVNKKHYEANKEKYRETNKKWREANKEQRKEYDKKYRKAKKEQLIEYNKKYYKAKKEKRAKWRKEGERRAKIRATWARKYVKNYDAHVKAYTDAKAYDKATIELNAYYEENRKRYLEVIGARLKLGLGTIKKPYPEK